MPTAAEIAQVACRVIYSDLKLRGGHREIIQNCGDWYKIEEFMVTKVEEAIAPLLPQPKQEVLDLDE